MLMQATVKSEYSESPGKSAEFTCGQCMKSFSSKSNLHIHSQIHTGERFYCELCHKSFTQKSNLKRHEALHLGKTKPYTCSVCSRPFTQKVNWVRHCAVVHGGNREYDCAECGKVFAQKSNLKKHLENHTKAIKVECVLEEGDDTITFPDSSFLLKYCAVKSTDLPLERGVSSNARGRGKRLKKQPVPSPE